MDEAGPEASALEAFWWVGPDPNAEKLEGEIKMSLASTSVRMVE